MADAVELPVVEELAAVVVELPDTVGRDVEEAAAEEEEEAAEEDEAPPMSWNCSL